jgi:hypothetical protein
LGTDDVRDLMDRAAVDVRAAEAIDLFCYRVKTGIGALSAVLGGLDSLVFSGGIGENSAEIRRRVSEGLEFLGIALDDGRNSSGAPLISSDAGPDQGPSHPDGRGVHDRDRRDARRGPVVVNPDVDGENRGNPCSGVDRWTRH